MKLYPRFMTLAVGTVFLLVSCAPSNNQSNNSKDPASDAVVSKVKSRLALGESNVWEPVPDGGVELGLGWDSREGRIVPNRCVHMAPVRSTGQTTVMSLDEVSGRTDIMKSLNVSAAGSVKTIFASASGSASFAKSSKVSSQSTTLLLNATITNGTLFAGPAEAAAPTRTAFPDVGDSTVATPTGKNNGRLTIEPWALALMKRPAEFRAYCGDGFVSAITSGARLLATFTFKSNSSEDRKSAAASVKASYGPANLSASASSSSQAASSKVETHVRYMQVGGAKGAIAIDESALKEKLSKLAAEAYDSPRFQDMRITPYSQMAEWRGSDAWRDSDDEYDIIAETYWQLTTLEEDVAYIIANYKDYNERSGRTKEELKDFQDDILTLRKTIYSALSHEIEGEITEQTNQEVKLFKDNAIKTSFTAPKGINLDRIGENSSLGQLANELRAALPFGNASLLRINLPIPLTVLGREEKIEKSVLQNKVIEWYIASNARRACQNNPLDNSCLSNKNLEEIAKMVPVR